MIDIEQNINNPFDDNDDIISFIYLFISTTIPPSSMSFVQYTPTEFEKILRKRFTFYNMSLMKEEEEKSEEENGIFYREEGQRRKRK